MSNYNKDTFLGTSNKNIKIFNVNSELVYTINPNSIYHISRYNNLVKIDLKDERVIFLEFSDSIESSNSLYKLQLKIDSLKVN